MDNTNQNLTTHRMLDALEQEPAQETPQPGNSALEALAIGRRNLEACRQYAEHLLECVLPQVFRLFWEARKLPELKDEPSDISGLTWGEVIERLKQPIRQKLSSSVPAVKRAVNLAKVRWICGSDEADAQSIWQKLIKDRYLLESEEVIDIDLSGKSFCINRDIKFTEGDIKEVVDLLTKVRDKIRSEDLRRVVKREQQKQTPPKKTRLELGTPMGVWRNKDTDTSFTLPLGQGWLKMESRPSQNNGPILIVTETHKVSGVDEGQSIPLSAIRDEDGHLRQNELHLNLSRIDGANDEKKRRQLDIWETLSEMHSLP
jgi:hypothetical protein